MAETIVVTGAAGFIGSNLVAALNQRGQDDLLLVDSLGTTQKWQTLLGLRFADLISPAQLLERLQEPDFAHGIAAIVHLGACSATTETDADF
ncbi:MAG: NAD-dependent epimerase/dehydratase family protein, partial [Actinomycetota bacterium]